MSETFDFCTFCHRQALIVEAMKEELRRARAEIRRLKTLNAKLKARNWPTTTQAAA